MVRRALMTGTMGQNGSHLAQLLMQKGHEVHGIKSRSSSLNTQRIDHIYQNPHLADALMIPHQAIWGHVVGDAGDVRPDEVYNLGAQSHVAVSFATPEYTANVDAIGTLRIIEAIRFCWLEDKTRLYQASTSVLCDKVQESPQSETTPFTLCGDQDVCLVDRGELSRGLWDLCLERHPVQSRIPGWGRPS